KARHQKVSRSFFYADPLALVPVGMPARVQSGNVLRRHQRGVFRPMRAWIKAKSASTAKIGRDRVNILEKLSFILERPSILEAGAVLQSGNIATEHAGATPRQTTHEDIFVVWARRHFCWSICGKHLS